MAWRNDQVSERETEKILELAKECLAVLGDFVEMGCYRGDTSILLAELLREAQKMKLEKGSPERKMQQKEKKLWLYDSFEGLPEKKAEDESAMGVEFKKGVLSASKREVKKRFLRAGLPVPRMIKGWFAELKPEDLPKEIAFAFLDGDLFESTRDCLRLVGPKMATGGIVVVHDFNNPALPGVARAVAKVLGERTIEVFESMAIVRGWGKVERGDQG